MVPWTGVMGDPMHEMGPWHLMGADLMVFTELSCGLVASGRLGDIATTAICNQLISRQTIVFELRVWDQGFAVQRRVVLRLPVSPDYESDFWESSSGFSSSGSMICIQNMLYCPYNCCGFEIDHLSVL